jgi:hypothetical protein
MITPQLTPQPARIERRAKSGNDGDSLSVCVFIDALGWRLLERNSWFLRGLADVRGSVETVLGYSCTCDPTILTGLLPRDHGHFSFFRFDPGASPFRTSRWLSRLPATIRDRNRVRSWLSRFERRRLGYSGYFHLYGMPLEWLHYFDYTEKRDLYRPGGIIEGQPTIFDRFAEGGVKTHVSDWRQPESRNLREALEAVARGGTRCLYLYLADLDGVMHAEGTDSPAVANKLREYDRALRGLVTLAQSRYRSVHLHVFSDHGMTDVLGTSDLRARVEALGLTFGTEYAAVYDSTLARFWFQDSAARRRVMKLLDAEATGRVLSADDLEVLGCDFGDDRYGEVIFLLEPGYVFDPSFMGPWVPRGMHGYHPDHADSAAAYLSNTTAAIQPRHLTDLHDLILRDCGVAP